MRRTLDQLDQLAHENGYDSYKDLLCDWYLGDQLALTEIADRLGLKWYQIRRHLIRFGFKIRSRGGANNVAIIVTMDLVREVARDGITVVAQRLGVQYPVLLGRIQQWIRENPGVQITLPE